MSPTLKRQQNKNVQTFVYIKQIYHPRFICKSAGLKGSSSAHMGALKSRTYYFFQYHLTRSILQDNEIHDNRMNVRAA